MADSEIKRGRWKQKLKTSFIVFEGVSFGDK